MRWSSVRRLSVGVGGALLCLLSLVLGLTVVAGAGNRERSGGVMVLTMLLSALFGFYLACAGMWANWVPSSSVHLRARSIRIALTWAILVGAYMILSLSALSPRRMLTRDWITVLVLVALLITCGIGIVGVTRRPRLISSLLALSGAYSLFVLIGALRVLAFPGNSAFVGPAVALSFLLAGSMSVALIAAALLAWPLRFNSAAGAI